MTDLDLTELERLAAKATPGPWKAKRTPYTGHASAAYYIMAGKRAVAHIKHSTISPMQVNAKLIAACSPEVLQRLIAIARAAVAWNESGPDRGDLQTALRESLRGVKV